MKPIRILLADDHAVLRAGLKALLNVEADMQVVGEADDGEVCVLQAVALKPDVVLMDINMPRCNGLEALVRIHKLTPECRVLILTMHDDPEYLRQVLSTGGAGYVLKQAASDELLSAIRAVHQGGIFLHSQHAQLLLQQQMASAQREPAMSDQEQRFQSLSEREAQVFRLVALGHRNGEIAEMLFLSVKTVETYKSRLMEKLGLHTRSALVRYALEMGALDEGDDKVTR